MTPDSTGHSAFALCVTLQQDFQAQGAIYALPNKNGTSRSGLFHMGIALRRDEYETH